MAFAMKRFKIALIQMAVGKNKTDNINRAVKMISTAKKEGSYLVVLPECFNSPYGTNYFPNYAEEVPLGETSKALSSAAKENEIFLVGGSFPEKDGNLIFNTCTVWGPSGDLVCKHRKIHLFDIDIPGEIQFMESKILTKGSSLTIFDAGICKIGLGICYDLRFQEMAAIYREKGVDLILYPGAFNMKTGPLHWELLLRSRAVDNQVFVAGICASQDRSADYVAWGHSLLVDPWGMVKVQAEFDETILYADIDLDICEKIRQQIPIMKQKRRDLYEIVDKSHL